LCVCSDRLGSFFNVARGQSSARNHSERIEINEAFAAVPLAVQKELGLHPDIVNVEGGAIAHGHPIGATGAVLIKRLLYAMERESLQPGIVALCICGGRALRLPWNDLQPESTEVEGNPNAA
jgi:hypothetical protein